MRGPGIFATDVVGIDWADGLIVIITGSRAIVCGDLREQELRQLAHHREREHDEPRRGARHHQRGSAEGNQHAVRRSTDRTQSDSGGQRRRQDAHDSRVRTGQGRPDADRGAKPFPERQHTEDQEE